MDELGVPTPRSRSRSKTPFVLRSQCDKEHCEDVDHGHAAVKKVPSVSIVEEESSSVAQRSSGRTTRKTIVAATSVETSHRTITTTSTITGSSSSGQVTASANGRGSAALTDLSSTVEKNQNDLNSIFEESARMRLRTSTPIQAGAAAGGGGGRVSRSRQQTERKHTSSVTLSEDGNDHVPYREYRDAGEYWNKYPKTDYTYSRLSPHRRELAPGVVAMPNMSRRSLDHHHERVNVMAHNAPDHETYIRTRYQATDYKSAEQRRRATYYDSQDSLDEVDEQRRSRTSSSWRITETRVVRWFLSIVTTLWTSCTSVFGGRSDRSRQERTYYYARMQQQQELGWFRRILSAVSSSFLRVFRYVYLAISTVLFLDTWLLRYNSAANNPKKKRFLLICLIILPLLMLAAWHLHGDETERNAPHPHRMPQLDAAAAAADVGGGGGGLPHFSFAGFPVPALDFSALLKLGAFFGGAGAAQSATASQEPLAPSDSSASGGGGATMSEQQYRALLSHLNGYVESYVNDRIVDAGQQQALPEPLVFSEQNVAAISAIVSQQIADTPRPPEASQTSAAPPPQAADIDRIVREVLQSGQFAQHIDASVAQHSTAAAAAHSERLIGDQQQLIRALRSEIEQINAKLAQNADAQLNIDKSLELLRAHQDTLSVQFREFQEANEQRLSALLLQINVRLEDVGRSQFAAIDDRVKLVLMDVLGYRSPDGSQPDEAALRDWLHSVFVSRSLLEERLLELSANRDRAVLAEIERSSGVLMKEITERIRAETLVLLERQRSEVLQQAGDELRVVQQEQRSSGVGVAVGEELIRQIVYEALAVYDADKTGLVDYALESAGGEIVSTRCTETYHTKSAQISIFGVPLWYPTNTPRTAISPTVQPGNCWAFQGFPGFLVLKLNALVDVTGFTMEHIPRSISPDGKIDSAPKTFTVWGLEHESDHEPYEFGAFEFAENGTNLQYFRVADERRLRPYHIVELRIESNHGNPNYTCLYRFRVHGTPSHSSNLGPSS